MDETPTRTATCSTLTVHVNGTPHTLKPDHRTTLLDLLRDHLGLTGTKKGCDHGQCGACTVLVEGRRANSCLLLAVQHDGAHVTTVEGLADGERRHPLQDAFVDRDAFQCGYCTPGQLCSAVGMLAEAASGHPSHVTPPPGTGEHRPEGAPVPLSRAEIRERMSGNICRCGAYGHIVDAIEDMGTGDTGSTKTATGDDAATDTVTAHATARTADTRTTDTGAAAASTTEASTAAALTADTRAEVGRTANSRPVAARTATPRAIAARTAGTRTVAARATTAKDRSDVTEDMAEDMAEDVTL